LHPAEEIRIKKLAKDYATFLCGCVPSSDQISKSEKILSQATLLNLDASYSADVLTNPGNGAAGAVLTPAYQWLKSQTQDETFSDEFGHQTQMFTNNVFDARTGRFEYVGVNRMDSQMYLSSNYPWTSQGIKNYVATYNALPPITYSVLARIPEDARAAYMDAQYSLGTTRTLNSMIVDSLGAFAGGGTAQAGGVARPVRDTVLPLGRGEGFVGDADLPNAYGNQRQRLATDPLVVRPTVEPTQADITRLSTTDIHTSGAKPAEARVAAELEQVLGGQMQRVTSGSADFEIISGPYKGKTVDMMFTTNNGTQREIDGMNRNFASNFKGNIDRLNEHLEKAQVVPLDYRKLTLDSQMLMNQYIQTLPAAQQARIIIIGGPKR